MLNPIDGLKMLRLENPYSSPVFSGKTVHTPSIYGLEDGKKPLDTTLPYSIHSNQYKWTA